MQAIDVSNPVADQSAGPMIDGLRFCQRRQSLSGEFPGAALPRLSLELAAQEGVVRFALQGGLLEGRPCLTLRVDAELVMPCQRCGRGMSIAVQSESRVLVAQSEEQVVAWEAEHVLMDALVADAKWVVAELVEDEVMLSLPISPRHPEGDLECECVVPV
jgi:uncharacterized protein